jgi:epoxyqueuosine reductase
LDNKTQKLVTALEAKATALGFDALNITAADSIPNAKERLNVFLEKNYHGSMGWMAETAERRAAPKALWSEVNSVIMLAMNYGPDDAPENHPLAHLSDKEGFRRHRAGHGKAAGRSGGAWLAGQAHQSGLARARLVAVLGRDLYHAGSARRCPAE